MMGALRILCYSFLILLYIIHNYDVLGDFRVVPQEDCLKPRKDQECLSPSEESPDDDGEVNQLDTKVFLFTCANQEEPEFLHQCNWGLPKNTYFNSSAKTVVLISGFFDSPCFTKWPRDMKNEVLKRDCVNMILLDYSWANSGDPLKFVELGWLRQVADQTVITLKNVMEQAEVSPNSFHLIGMSTGAQLCGFVGQQIKNIGRITALDAAVPYFYRRPIDERLDPTDALLVDVIHTGANHCSNKEEMVDFSLGYPDPIGHADFYVNGGYRQPAGCPHEILFSLLKGDYFLFIANLIPGVCDHSHSRELYKASINPGDCQFVGVEGEDYDPSFDCSKGNCAIMGYDFDKFYKNDGRQRRYYVRTTVPCPYCEKEDYKRYLNTKKCIKRKKGQKSSATSVPTKNKKCSRKIEKTD